MSKSRTFLTQRQLIDVGTHLRDLATRPEWQNVGYERLRDHLVQVLQIPKIHPQTLGNIIRGLELEETFRTRAQSRTQIQDGFTAIEARLEEHDLRLSEIAAQVNVLENRIRSFTYSK